MISLTGLESVILFALAALFASKAKLVIPRHIAWTWLQGCYASTMDNISRRRFVAGLAAAPALGLVGQARGVPSLISHNAYYVNSTEAGSDFYLSIAEIGRASCRERV